MLPCHFYPRFVAYKSPGLSVAVLSSSSPSCFQQRRPSPSEFFCQVICFHPQALWMEDSGDEGEILGEVNNDYNKEGYVVQPINTKQRAPARMDSSKLALFKQLQCLVPEEDEHEPEALDPPRRSSQKKSKKSKKHKKHKASNQHSQHHCDKAAAAAAANGTKHADYRHVYGHNVSQDYSVNMVCASCQQAQQDSGPARLLWQHCTCFVSKEYFTRCCCPCPCSSQAVADVEIKATSYIHMHDVQQLVLWVLGEAISPRWVFTKVSSPWPACRPPWATYACQPE